MPKRGRSETDEEHLGCLVKNHISQKEVNTGVLQEKNMQVVFNNTMDKLKKGAIYNKTREKLFNGVKNLANNNVNNTEESLEKLAESHDKVRYTQLCLTNSGSFTKLPLSEPTAAREAFGGENWEFCSCSSPGCRIPPGQVCSSCWRGMGDTCSKRCSSCATGSCGLCDQVRSCSRCWGAFCGNCAVKEGETSCLCYDCKS